MKYLEQLQIVPLQNQLEFRVWLYPAWCISYENLQDGYYVVAVLSCASINIYCALEKCGELCVILIFGALVLLV